MENNTLDIRPHVVLTGSSEQFNYMLNTTAWVHKISKKFETISKT